MAKSASEKAILGKKVALGVSGGIAAYKAAEILRGLQRAGCSVRVAMTKRACEFVQPLTFRALSGAHVVVDDYAADNPDPIAHITFSQSVDLLLVAPATANLIAKFANGVADDFLTTTYLACTAPVLIAPAMNTTMWNHPATQHNLARLRDHGVYIIDPDEGEMACGTVGPGRLSDPDRIVTAALEVLQSTVSRDSADLAHERFLITTGATREAIDPVRFISNRSSGRMGFALAEAALRRGASVTVVAGTTTANPPRGIRLLKAASAEEMYHTVMSELGNATVFVAAAAVADYRPAMPSATKVKKAEATMVLPLERTRDILREVSASRKDGLLVIGFAAETENILNNALGKLKDKDLDAIVANDVSRTDAGFDSPRNEITIITRAAVHSPRQLPLMDKREAAHCVLDEVVKLREAFSSPTEISSV
ncbi:MAG TPA: bifunctional phosphopantothenoylcysteine decarboxylase/phosphopantothenate--cysteine ligase CoaBC [Pyrinomonadaceae bacterium]|nr:bifunctional phosphopantothenoylcysteine decarboxylase/phosphopantothenate--cysteine ligase CoaBC [Pyrinomonadaceae bacterium]